MRRIIVIVLLDLLFMAAGAQVNIWEGTAVKKKVELTPHLTNAVLGSIIASPHSQREIATPHSRRENCHLSPAVIICPGGSYFWHDTETEGHVVGRWLQENGISAFVLNYRTAYVPAFVTHFRWLFRGNRYPDPQDDLRQAIRYVKAHAAEWHIDPSRIGVMGFSAGGHLAMSAAENFDGEDRPAFVAPIYPVVTMTEECVHKRSRRGLLGDSRTRNKELRDRLSLERHVPADCPPVFLVNCLDDPVVDYRNSVLLDSALTAKNVRHQYMQFRTGGHGFGASEEKGTAECRQWKEEFIKWMKEEIYGK